MSTLNATTRMLPPDRPLGQLWQVPTFFLGLLALSLVAANSHFRQDPFALYFQQEMTALRQGLTNPADKVDPLIALAENLVVQANRFTPKSGEVLFLIGSAYWRQSLEMPKEKAGPIRVKAEEYLTKALNLGVTDNDAAPLNFRLGMLLYQQGKNLPRAIEMLTEGVDKGTDAPARGYEMLVEAHLRVEHPNLQAALLANQRQLENLGDNKEDLARARLLRGELLFRADRRVDALRTLDAIKTPVSKSVRSKARLLQTRCCEAEGLWRRAMPLWKDLLDDPDAVPGGKGQIYYSLGLCHWNSDPSEPEAASAHWQEAMAQGGEEAQAASLRLGELRLPSDAGAALKAWTSALTRVRKAAEYRNGYVSLNQVRELFESACKQLLETQDFAVTEQLAELYKRIALPGRAEIVFAQATENLARQLQEKKASDQANAQFLRAAKAYEDVANACGDKDKGEFLWRSAACYLPANDFTQTVKVLKKLVEVEKVEARLAEGWLALAETYQALKNKELARQAYYKCIEYPDNPFVYRARYQLALEEKDRKKIDQAILILKQNLLSSKDGLSDRAAQEKSQFLLGAIYFQERKFDQAAFELQEAVRQYPQNPGILVAREQLGDCLRNLADSAGAKMLDAIKNDARAYHQMNKTKWLDQAALTFQALADDLELQARKNPLTKDELRMLRKALFGVADIRRDLNDLDDALRRYQQLQERYRKQVESLIACQRVVLCAGRVTEPSDRVRAFQDAARTALQMAADDLKTMDENSEAFRGGIGVWSKRLWESWLSNVSNPSTPTPTPSPASTAPTNISPGAVPARGLN